ncbi:MAG TPA: pitrilysin family protein [Saprospiraceae bacterium]|nr:pitrilysin family protein [Saprospiraceae bacterium]
MRRLSALVTLLFTGTFLIGQSGKIEFVEYDLPNGLHVILHQDKSTAIVAVSVMYHVGSKNENPNRTGFAHFFEHLMFEGSEYIDRGEYDKYVQKAGGTLNANTSYDRTYYYQILPSHQLALGLWLESERMLHAKVDMKGIETQREVVKEERRQRVDNQPYGSVLEESMSRAFTVHPYKWPTIGSMTHLEAAVEQDYVQFYKDFYVPNNAVLAIAGDIDIDAAKMLIDKYFSGIPKSTKPVYRPNIIEPSLKGEVRDTILDNVQLPAVIQTYRIPAQGTKDYYAVDMLARLLSTGESSRLYKKLVDEEQKALFVGNFPLQMEDPGVALTFGICNVGVDPKDLEASVDAVIARTRSELISDREFQKLRNQIENEFVSANSRVAGLAENLATYYMFFGDTGLVNSEIDRYMAVTREDIREAARKYFNEYNRVSLYYMPKTKSKS